MPIVASYAQAASATVGSLLMACRIEAEGEAMPKIETGPRPIACAAATEARSAGNLDIEAHTFSHKTRRKTVPARSVAYLLLVVARGNGKGQRMPGGRNSPARLAGRRGSRASRISFTRTPSCNQEEAGADLPRPGMELPRP